MSTVLTLIFIQLIKRQSIVVCKCSRCILAAALSKSAGLILWPMGKSSGEGRCLSSRSRKALERSENELLEPANRRGNDSI